ncbi:MAG: hypothetical protein H6806_02285 [Planctomycetes bacterium]|nr:hypothetical protein [Planctomycetota bacterium]
MIRFLATRAYLDPIRAFLDSFGQPLVDTLVPVTYEDLRREGRTPRCLHVFSDVDRLRPRTRAVVCSLADQLESAGVPFWNDPRRAGNRVELSRRWVEAGLNDFRVAPLAIVRAAADHGGLQPPWFLRVDGDHQGGRSEPCDDLDGLLRAARRLRRRGKDAASMIVVEWRDARDDTGRVIKHGVFRIGDRLVQRHRFAGTRWMLKVSEITDVPDVLEREWAWFQNPPAGEMDLVRKAFDVAGIEFGRIDYVPRPGGIRVWEINTNPNLFLRYELTEESTRTRVHQRSAAGVVEAFRAADAPPLEGAPLELEGVGVGAAERLAVVGERIARMVRKGLP